MGHITAKGAYVALQQRLDRMPIGAPAHPELFALLKDLYTEEECRIAAAMPIRLATAAKIAATAGMDPARVAAALDVMADKGLVVDFPIEGRATRYFLNPTIVGFFEFTMMRTRTDIDQTEAAKHLWNYLYQDPTQAFRKDFTGGTTFIARPLVHEDMLDPGTYTEVLDYEKATHIVETGGAWSEGLCYCRHIKQHLGTPCKHPLGFCLSFGAGAEYLIRHGLAQRIEKARAMDILTESRERGLVQMADNVKHHPYYICNCCKCCCEMMEGLRSMPREAHVVSSNYLATVDADKCNGCGKCVKACPVNVIDFTPAAPTDAAPKRKQRAVVNHDLCLGCAVCTRTCPTGALAMTAAPSRTYTPERMMERLVVAALERGKLQNMIFDDPNKVTHRALRAFLGAVANLPPTKRLLAREQIKSKFIERMLANLPRV